MKKVLILHGWGGSDYPHWQSQLASYIIQNDGCVSFPKLKNKDLPKKDE
ncbi:MAG: alpha/beta hydrolase [Sulfurovum sp.]